MKKKPDPQLKPEIRRCILEKLVMGRNWGHNHIEEDDVPKGLPKLPNSYWYFYVKRELRREGLLTRYKEHGKDLYTLNIKRKTEIERACGF